MLQGATAAVIPAPQNPFEAFVINALTCLMRNVEDLIETQQYLVSVVVTHDELHDVLEERLGVFKQELKTELKTELTTELSVEIGEDVKAHTTKMFSEFRDEIRSLLKKCDGRTDDVVVTLERKKIVTPTESKILLKTSPFAT